MARKGGGETVDVNDYGEGINGDTPLLLSNADHGNRIEFTLPPTEPAGRWELILHTTVKDPRRRFRTLPDG